MVRRDWCPLSKQIGNTVLDEILSQKAQEDIECNLREFFTDVAHKLEHDQYNLKEYIITKQLTRAPSEYQNAATFPHVSIANRMKSEQHKSDSELVNQFIPYVITEGTEKQYAARAFSPDEFMAKKLRIDKKWYLTQQIYPPISRLIEHIEGIDSVFLSECFGLESKQFANTFNQGDQISEVEKFQVQLEEAKEKSNLERKKIQTLLKLKVKCISCKYNNPKLEQEEIEFPGLMGAELLNDVRCQNVTSFSN